MASDIIAVPIAEESHMRIGYITHQKGRISRLGTTYLEALKHYVDAEHMGRLQFKTRVKNVRLFLCSLIENRLSKFETMDSRYLYILYKSSHVIYTDNNDHIWRIAGLIS